MAILNIQNTIKKIQEKKATNPMATVKPTVATTPVVPTSTPVVLPRKTTTQNLGMGNLEEVKAHTLATRDNPIISVSTTPKPVDIGTADMSTLLKEQDAINYKISTGNYTQDDYVRGREISRKLAETMYQTPEATVNPYVSELEAKAEALKNKDYNPDLEAKRTIIQSQLNIRKAQLEENARRARDSQIGNIAMAGGGRSSVAQQAELDINRQLTDQLNAEQAAADLEMRAYEAQLRGASDEELQGIYKQINELKGTAAQ